MREYSDGLANIIFVGRCAPNKKIEDLMSAFSYFQQTVEPRSRFIQVGSYTGTERYQAYIQAFGREHNVDNFLFSGSIRQDRLNAIYAKADLFLSMSEHEGFCIPLIESMTHDVPVLAYAAAAVPETLDGAGVLFHEKNYEMIAEMMGKLVHDSALREAVLKGQRERLKRFEDRNLEEELRGHLAPLLN